jgi:hypothetical protein
MIVPAHTAKATAGFVSCKNVQEPRFDYQKVSPFHNIKEKGYDLDDDLWRRVYDSTNSEDIELLKGRGKRGRRSCRRRSSLDHTKASMQDRLAQLKKAMLRELKSPVPIAKANISKVRYPCVRILGIISDEMREDKSSGTNCFCFAEMLLNVADHLNIRYNRLDVRNWWRRVSVLVKREDCRNICRRLLDRNISFPFRDAR